MRFLRKANGHWGSGALCESLGGYRGQGGRTKVFGAEQQMYCQIFINASRTEVLSVLAFSPVATDTSHRYHGDTHLLSWLILPYLK